MSRFTFRGWMPQHLPKWATKPVPGRMLDHHELFIYGEFRLSQLGIERICGPEGETWGESTDIILMQSTGLTDKNGKEIFEGDVIAHYLSSPIVVEWFDERGGFLPWCDEDEFAQATAFEVLGNIYENPELLK